MGKELCQSGKKMGRKLRALSKWEWNGKEIMNIFVVGGKWDRNKECFGEEREKEGKIGKSVRKLAKTG